MKILLIDAYSITHVGNAALADSALDQLRSFFPDAQYAVLAFDPDSLGELCGCPVHETLWAEALGSSSVLRQALWFGGEALWMLLNALNTAVLHRIGLGVNPRRYTRSASKLAALEQFQWADVVISIGGEVLQDKFLRRLPFFLYSYWLAHALGKLMVIFPQSIGPLEHWLARAMVRWTLNRCDLVFPRDHLSLETIESLRLKPGIAHLVPDVAVNQPALDPAAARALLEQAGVDFSTRPLIGMAISRWGKLDLETYFAVMRQLCFFVRDQLGGSVVLFSPNMPFRNELSDYEIAQQLHSSLPDQRSIVLLDQTYTPRQFKGMLGELDLFMSTRMHASILATMIGTPTITINTQPKLFGFMSLVGQAQRSCAIQDFTYENATRLIRETLDQGADIRQALIAAQREVGARSRQASRLLQQIYQEKQAR